MPTNIYRKPKNKVIQVFRGKEVEKILLKALQSAFQPEGITVKPAKVKRILGSIPQSVLGGDVVLIVEQFPLDSLQAHGKFKGLTYQVVGKTGTQYARDYEEGANPRTPLQQAQRGKMSPAQSAWQSLSPAQKAIWDEKAKGLQDSGHNLFVSNYLLTH